MKIISVKCVTYTYAFIEVSDEQYEAIMEDGGYMDNHPDLINQAETQVEHDRPCWEVDGDEPVTLKAG